MGAGANQLRHTLCAVGTARRSRHHVSRFRGQPSSHDGGAARADHSPYAAPPAEVVSLAASLGRRVLCVLDDVRDPSHARLIGEALGGAMLLVTTPFSTLWSLSSKHFDNQVKIAKAGGIAPLVA